MKQRIAIIFLVILQMFGTLALAVSSPLYVFGKDGAGDFDNDYLKNTNPDISWVGVDVAGNNSAKDMALQMQTNNECFDLYAIGYAYSGFSILRDKGFCLDLSPYPEIMAIVANMYPYLQEAVSLDGKLYAVPIGVSVSGWAYNPTVFHDAGIDSVPQTYAEFLDLAQWWIDSGYTQHSDYPLFLGITDSRKYLIEKIIYDYVNYCTLQGIAIDFECNAIYSLLHAVELLDTDELDQQMAEATFGIAYGTDTLFALNYNYSNLSGLNERQFTPLHLRFEENDTFYPADVRLFAINPKSTHIDTAVEYIVTFLEGMDAEKKLTLLNDSEAAPIENPSYEDALENNRSDLAMLFSAGNQEDGAIEEMRRELQNELAAIEQNRWLVTKEQIEQYSTLTAQFRVREQNILERNSTNGTLEIQAQIQKFVQHEMTLDQFVKEANRIITMILMEES